MLPVFMSPQIELTPTTFAIVAGVLILIRWAAEFYLTRLNESEVRRNQDRVPSAFAEIIDEETYRKSVQYTLARYPKTYRCHL